MASYRDRFLWLADSLTHGARGVAYMNNFAGRGLSYWPTEWSGRPVVGLEMKAFRTPEAAVDAALAITPDQRAAAEAQNAARRKFWEDGKKK